MRPRWVLKPTVLLFGVVAAGSALYGLLQGYKSGETLIAATILGAFVLGVAAVARVTDARLKRR
jgi:hypothetical protein